MLFYLVNRLVQPRVSVHHFVPAFFEIMVSALIGILCVVAHQPFAETAFSRVGLDVERVLPHEKRIADRGAPLEMVVFLHRQERGESGVSLLEMLADLDRRGVQVGVVAFDLLEVRRD